MIVTIAAFKGGVGKTTTAVHLAAYLSRTAPTVLIDGDPNRSATGWAARGDLPFQVADADRGAALVGAGRHVVIDTQARPTPADLRELATGCDVLVIPCSPDVLAIEALLMTIRELRAIAPAAGRYRVLLTMIPPKPSREGDEARAMLAETGIPHFDGGIRRAVAFQKAAFAGVCVERLHDARARAAWTDYEHIGDQLAAGEGMTK
jgi:chromosome partitioning protein